MDSDFHADSQKINTSDIDYGDSRAILDTDTDIGMSNNESSELNNCTHHEATTPSDIDFIFEGVGLSFLALFGIPANILSVIVLKHPRMKSSLTTLLLGLTISDMFVISTSSLIFSFPVIFDYIKIFPSYTAILFPSFLPWMLPIALIAQMSSVYLTVIVTLERYIAVCLPLKARSFCTQSTARNSTVIVIIFSVLYNMPRWFEYETVLKLNCTNIFKYTLSFTKMRLDEDYILYYVNLSYLVVLYLIPFSILLFFNIAIYCEATKQRRARRDALSPSMANSASSTSSNNEDLALAGMLFGIVITFFACNMLSLVINVMESFMMEGYYTVISISNFLIVFGCSTNFVFYCAFGKKFRSHLMLTLGIRKASLKDQGESSGDHLRMTSVNLKTLSTSSSKSNRNSMS